MLNWISAAVPVVREFLSAHVRSEASGPCAGRCPDFFVLRLRRVHGRTPFQAVPCATTLVDAGTTQREREFWEMDGTGQETYTAEQREQLESGLRILARMIVRAHLRRQQEPLTSDEESGLEGSESEG